MTAPPPRSRLYLDTNVIIYAAELPEAPWSGALAALFRRVESGELAAVTSELSLAECLVWPLQQGNEMLVRFYEDRLTHSDDLAVIPVSRGILLEAARLRAESGTSLRLPDAIHLATAIATGCTHFLTNDRRIPQLASLVNLDVRTLPG